MTEDERFQLYCTTFLALIALMLVVATIAVTAAGLNHRVDKYRDVLCAQQVALDDCPKVKGQTLEQRIQALEAELAKERAK